MAPRAAAILGLLLLAGGAARGGESTTEEDALRRFARAFAETDAGVRRKAVGILEGIPGPRAAEALIPALVDPSPRVRERARDALAGRASDAELEAIARAGLGRPEPEARRRCADLLARAGAPAAPQAERLTPLLKDRDPLVREAAAAALGATGHRGQAPAVAAAFAREGTAEAAGALLDAWGALDPEGALREAARVVGREKEGPPCVAALRVLRAGDPDGAERAARDLLRHPAWEVRVAAAAALGGEGSGPPAVDALLEALRKEKRLRVRGEIAAGLERLTGAPFGDDLDRWRSWWETRRNGWTPPEARPPAREARGPRDGGESAARFYDIPLDGDRVVFALDTSRSMLDPARIGEEATKMQVALAEAAKTFATLGDGVHFNVVAFGTEVESWKPRAVPAGPSSKYEALRFLQKRPLEGRTNIFDALATAMADPGVDTVFLLTDGAPTEGEATSRTGFLEGLAHLRRWRPVRVHCVEVGASNTGSRWKGFLAEVAKACGGVHVAR